MNTVYAKRNSSKKKEANAKTSSVLDSSSQGESLQRKADMANGAVQREESPRPNNTGMPDNLKAGIESLSGFSMDDVRVHYNSSKPATVQALAYTQGTDIHVAPGQEKHLPHEAWHVAQQMAGRVSPTTNINGMPVNDNAALEHEADVMGEKAVQCKSKTADTKKSVPLDGKNIQRLKYDGEKKKVVNIFCRIWNGIYDEILKNKEFLIEEKKIGSIGPISLILTSKHTTSFSSNGTIVWINKNDVNGNPDQLLQKCLHELGHYVDGNSYAQEYHIHSPKGCFSDHRIVPMGRELYADMFAFVVRIRKERPKNENDLERMIESIDLSGRPQTWIEVQVHDGYPPAEYTKKLFFEYGKLLMREKQKSDIVKIFDENFNNVLIQLSCDMQQHKFEMDKGVVLCWLKKWDKGDSFATAKNVQGSIDYYALTENDIPKNYKRIWEKWKLQKKIAVETLISMYNEKKDVEVIFDWIEKYGLTENDLPQEHKDIWKLRKEFVIKTLVDWYNGRSDAKKVQDLIEEIPLTEDDIPENYKHIWKRWRLQKNLALQTLVEWNKGIIGAKKARYAIDKISLRGSDIPEDFQRYWDTWNFEKPKKCAKESLIAWYGGKVDAKIVQEKIDMCDLVENDIPEIYKHIWKKWKLQKRFALKTLVEWNKGKIGAEIVRKAIDKIALTEDDIPEGLENCWNNWILDNVK